MQKNHIRKSCKIKLNLYKSYIICIPTIAYTMNPYTTALQTDISVVPTLTVTELKTLAKNIGMSGYHALKKAELAEKIIKNINNTKEIQRKEAARRQKEQEAEEAHRATRNCLDITARQQEFVDELIETLEYPYEFLRSGDYDNTPDDIPGQPTEDVRNFPDNVEKYYWISPGENDERPWLTLCRLTNGIYVFYKGECDYTGFDCQGSMELYASKDASILIKYAMTSSDYAKYIEDTVEM